MHENPQKTGQDKAEDSVSRARRPSRRRDDQRTGESVRRCAVTGERNPKEGLLRLVVDPEGLVFPDIEESLPGRGIWVSARRDVLADKGLAGRFSRSAKCKVNVPLTLEDVIETMLVRRCGDLIGLARRAGQAVAGLEKVDEVLDAARPWPPGMIMLASDAGRDGHRSGLDRKAGVSVYRCLTADELGQPFSRPRTVYAAVASGRLCKRIERECLRLSGFRPAVAQSDGC